MRPTIFILLLAVIINPISKAGSGSLSPQQQVNDFQVNDFYDIILLTNGAAIHGRIIEQANNGDILIETHDGYYRNVPSWRIAVVTDTDNLEREQARILHTLEHKTPVVTYSNIVQIGAFMGDSLMPFAISLVNGVTIWDRLQVGFGVGWEVVSDHSFVPIVIDIRHYWVSDWFGTFVYLSAGYGFGWYNKSIKQEDVIAYRDKSRGADYGGPAFGFGVGLMLKKSNMNSFRLQVGYKYQRCSTPEVVAVRYNLFGFMFGFSIL